MLRLVSAVMICALLYSPINARASIEVAPHKALYTMSMGKIKPGSNLQDIAGTMAFDWSDGCDGWVLQQHIAFEFVFSDGANSKINSTMMTWEAKDGSSLTYYIKRLMDDREEESFKGKATLEPTGGTAHFSVPHDTKPLQLPQGTLFPTHHTLMILEKAMAGENLFTRKVFSGSETDHVEEVSAFISAAVGPEDLQKLPESLQLDPLLNAPAWPVRMAFYDPTLQTGEPDYEMELTLQSNGIARRIEIDYGEFSVVGTLEQIEKSTTLACPMPALAPDAP